MARCNTSALGVFDKKNPLCDTNSEFLRILEGREASMTGADGIDDLTLVLKAYESMELGVPLPLSQSKN